MTAERDELVVPIRLGEAMEPEQPDRFPLVALWLRLDGQARAFAMGVVGLFASIAYVAGPGWAGIVTSAVVLLDAFGFTFERGES